MLLAVYSSLLLVVLVVGSPYWLVRMLTSGRYRAGLAGRLGRVPAGLRELVAGRDVVWVHAVSVGEALAATRLIEELRAAVPGLVVAVSTTTETGQRLARTRFPDAPVFFLPMDFGWLMRRYLRVLRPRLVVLMESELWPNMIAECGRAGVPVAVANARMSDRSFARAMRLRGVWRRMFGGVDAFLAQSEEDARRLEGLGARAVRVAGNLKYDIRVPGESRVAELVREAAAGRPVVVAGSTVESKLANEEELVLRAMERVWEERPEVVLVLAPRHPDRFSYAYSIAQKYGVVRATEMLAGERMTSGARQTIVLDTIGDLAAVYGVADVAFVGGSLVRRAGHNPLEPAQWGVPVVMGESYENFRAMVDGMRAAEAVRIVSAETLSEVLLELIEDKAEAAALGERGRVFFRSQAGATERVVAALMGWLR